MVVILLRLTMEVAAIATSPSEYPAGVRGSRGRGGAAWLMYRSGGHGGVHAARPPPSASPSPCPCASLAFKPRQCF